MAATQTDLATRVLQKLKVLGVGQSANADDIAVAKQSLTEVHASLRKDERVRWSLQELPEAAEVAYVYMAAFLCADDFGTSFPNGWAYGQGEITSLINTPKSGETTRTEYF